MPPNQKITLEMIVETAYQLCKENGIDEVNSRNLAKKLNCSTQPIFSQFPNMEVLKQKVHDYACEIFEEKVLNQNGNDSFLRSSYLTLIHLAQKERNIFQLIYLSKYCIGMDFIRTRMNFSSNQKVFNELKEQYHLENEECIDLLERISLLAYGIASLIATSNVIYDIDRIIQIVEGTLHDVINGIIERRIKE